MQLKQEHPSRGAPKIRAKLRRMNLGVQTPAISAVHAVLDRHGLVTRRRGHRPRAQGRPLSQRLQPNDLWCADYKGEFMLADHRYCYPLTVSDSASRYVLAGEALAMRCPTELYTPSPRPHRGLEELDYPFHDHAHIVTRCGRICFRRRKINLSTVFAGQKVGVKEVNEVLTTCPE